MITIKDKGGAILFEINESELSTFSFAGKYLRGAQLAGMDLTGLNFRDANLEDADLQNTNLSGANLDKSNLSNTNFSKSFLDGASFVAANLSGSNLTGVSAKQSVFEFANMTSIVAREADFTGANFRETNLSNADCTNAIMKDSYLHWTNVRYANFRGTNFANARGLMCIDKMLWPQKFEHAQPPGGPYFNQETTWWTTFPKRSVSVSNLLLFTVIFDFLFFFKDLLFTSSPGGLYPVVDTKQNPDISSELFKNVLRSLPEGAFAWNLIAAFSIAVFIELLLSYFCNDLLKKNPAMFYSNDDHRFSSSRIGRIVFGNFLKL